MVDYVPYLSPRYMRPTHLAPFLDRLDLAARGIPQRVVCHAPPRFAKTESVAHFPAFVAERYPQKTVGYGSYGDRLTRRTSKKARRLLTLAGVQLDSDTMLEARTKQGGGFFATSTTGVLTGFGIDIMIIDDATKNRIEAESPTYRARLEDWYNDVVATRIEPGGSIFYIGTRWREDDLPAYLVKQGFEYICLPAIVSENGVERSLWPERWPLDVLQGRRASIHDYTWQSLYQGNPRPRGTRVFHDAHTYSEAPRVFRTAFGVDLSYAATKTADYSVVVKMRKQGGHFYVVDCFRAQVSAPSFRQTCHEFHVADRSAPWRWYMAGPELGVANFFSDGDEAVPIEAVPARGDKFTRALNYAAAWNAGRVLVPEDAPWLSDFLEEHASFTGSKDKHDDIIDAAVAAFDLLDGGDEFTRDTPMPATRRSEFEPPLL